MDNYLKEVIDQVEQETGYNLLTTGMDVYTNVDPKVQQHLWDIYNTDEYVNYPDDEMQVASTIVDVDKMESHCSVRFSSPIKQCFLRNQPSC